MLWRSCTGDYKLAPIRKKTRELWAAGGRRPVAQHIGISLDEIGRMKDSRVGYITFQSSPAPKGRCNASFVSATTLCT